MGDKSPKNKEKKKKNSEKKKVAAHQNTEAPSIQTK